MCTFAPAMRYSIVMRHNRETGNDEGYYRLIESYRDAAGRQHTRCLLSPGFIHGYTSEELRWVPLLLTRRLKSKEHPEESADLWGGELPGVPERSMELAETFWRQMVEAGTIDDDLAALRREKAECRHLLRDDSLEHEDGRDVGAEWLCLQAVRQLRIDAFLKHEGWSARKIQNALALLITRTVYGVSENKCLDIIAENSALMELPGMDDVHLNSENVYKIAPALYALKEKLERHLCHTTDSLFNLTNRIMLFDLTNFYFESPKRHSKKAKRSRSKERRNDCPLLVLALCINTSGFIRYCAILEGNTADPKSLPDMVEKLIARNPVSDAPLERVLVIMDAGIATEENLELLLQRGYDYLCVSRTRLKEYELAPDAGTVTVKDNKDQDIYLTRVAHDEGGDYYLRIESPAKQMKEESMNSLFRKRFEAGLEAVRAGLSKKSGIKRYDKVCERVGRLKARYPSVSRYYTIEYDTEAVTHEKRKRKGREEPPETWTETRVTAVRWTVDTEGMMTNKGVYFLRTNREKLDERTTWDYYNIIREIECTNRQCKTDLKLRPIYHQKDDNSDAHLFFGLLAYWIVNTIRYQLKKENERRKKADPDPKAEYPTPYWTEIVRTMRTQKAVTTTAINSLGEKVEYKMCTKPTDKAKEIYQTLKYKPIPFKKMKICRIQT